MMFYLALAASIPFVLALPTARDGDSLTAHNRLLPLPIVVVDESAQRLSVSWEGVPDFLKWELDGIEEVQEQDGDRVVDIAKFDSLESAIDFDPHRWRSIRLNAFSKNNHRSDPQLLGSWMLLPDGTIFEVCCYTLIEH